MGAVFSSMAMGMGSVLQPAGAEGPPKGKPYYKSWRNWAIGVILAIALPFVLNKWSTLAAIKNKADTMAKTVETMVEVLEKVAEEVAEVADEVDDQLPEGSNLKFFVEIVENAAKETSKDAHIIDQLIEQVEEEEKEIESVFEGEKVQKMIVKLEDEVRKEDRQQKMNKMHEVAMEVSQVQVIKGI